MLTRGNHSLVLFALLASGMASGCSSDDGAGDDNATGAASTAGPTGSPAGTAAATGAEQPATAGANGNGGVTPGASTPPQAQPAAGATAAAQPADGPTGVAVPPAVTPPGDGMTGSGMPMVGMPMNGMPMDGMPTDGMPMDGMPADGMPTDGMPTDGTPMDGVPMDGVLEGQPPVDAPRSETLVISDLTLEANPNNVLSAYVSWTTNEPASSTVQFGVGELQWQISDVEQGTEHRVLVIGMRAQSDYSIRALSVNDGGSAEADDSFTTGMLPAGVPQATVQIPAPDLVSPGWTLMNVFTGNNSLIPFSSQPPAAVVFDSEGYPVWYWVNGSQTEIGGAISVDPTDVGVLMGPSSTSAPTEVDWAGDVLWQCSSVTCGGSDALSHHAGKLSNGNYVTMRDVHIANGGTQSFAERISQTFEELDASGQSVHSIGVEDGSTPPDNLLWDDDWAHGNSISIDLENDFAYLSFRWLGMMKFKYSTRELIYHMPASYAEEKLGMSIGDMTFVPPESKFTDIHEPEIHDDGTILFFDNGGYTGMINEGNPDNLQTRALEFQIDEAAKTATLVWEWPGDFDVDNVYKTELYVPFWGDADRVDNGNVLITAGRLGAQNATPLSRVIEVAKDDGQVVWELELPRAHGVYRAERIQLPMVQAIQ